MSSLRSRSRRSTGTTTTSMAAGKVWLELNRKAIPVARCTVERLMGQLGLRGARRGGKVRTTKADRLCCVV
jgi:transposase InsO family protein